MKKYLLLFLLVSFKFAYSQNIAPLTVQKIMRDSRWIGSSPSNVFWSPDGTRIYFNWNPTASLSENESIYVGGENGVALSDSLYFITLKDYAPKKVPFEKQGIIEAQKQGVLNQDQSLFTFIYQNTIYLLQVKSGNLKPIFQTTHVISNAHFGFHDTKIVFQQEENLFAFNLESGGIEQLTDFKKGKPDTDSTLTPQEIFLQNDALENSVILRQRKTKNEILEEVRKEHINAAFPKIIFIEDDIINNLEISPNGRFVTYNLTSPAKDAKATIVPHFVSQSGYVEAIPSRPVVGAEKNNPPKTFIYDRLKDSVYPIFAAEIPGIKDLPEYLKNYPDKDSILTLNPPKRSILLNAPVWNQDGSKAFVVIRSLDFKDRWIMLLQPETGKLKLLDRQRNEAWVGWAPGIGYISENGNVGWVDKKTIWFQSEQSGFSHLYIMDLNTKKKKALTSGSYEVQSAQLSPDKKTFYLSTNEVEPSQVQFYQFNIQSGKKQRITSMMGGNEVTVSPDGKNIAILYSTAIHPWELYLQGNNPSAKAIKITDKAESKAYQSYKWRKPEIITFKDRAGFSVYASIYKPKHPAPTHPGVMFVHGAGYLQDVVHWWSYYYREHMFMNMLVDEGYTVMEVDYRGSAGYGRDWRTAIYRHMGNNDLADIVDGAKYMVADLEVNPKKIGIWGGSYGGFMTLMALFKTNTFACGAALRSVTDWAHYNDGYTGAILNYPQDDSIAYVQSSPIYFADGLQAPLLMCHGMVDDNVHFQDIVRLSQKLIELKKKNWELAVYPVESHDFKEPSSWNDEYSRIYRLFNTYLK